MKKSAILFMAVILGVSFYGQDNVTDVTGDTTKINLWTIYPGYIIDKNNDTINGYLKLKNLANNQDKVFFYKDSTGKKDEAIKYKPKDLKAYQVGPRYYESYKFRPGVSTYAANDANTYHFVLRVIDGPFSIYKWYYETTQRSEERVKIDEDKLANTQIDLSFNENELKHVTLGKIRDGEIINFQHMLLGFKKKMSKVVADYPELSKKIANKEDGYRSSDIEKIAREYNEWYKGNHKME